MEAAMLKGKSWCAGLLVMAVGAFGILGTRAEVSAQAKDSVIGTWTLNVAKSTFTPGPPFKSGTVTFHAAGEGVHVVADLVDGTGAKVHSEYTANYDGKDVPIKGVTGVETVSLKRIDANSAERTDKMKGKVVQTYTRKIAADGKTMTVTQKGTGSDGKPFTNELLFEKK
jgi:hypothetical protein